MKKLTAILLLILMLIPLIVSCGGSDETTTTEAPTTEAPTTEAPTTEAPTTEAPTTQAPTTQAPVDMPWSSKTDVRKTWAGKTLAVACSSWSASPGAPWSVMELCIDYGVDSGFGAAIDTAVLERQEFIEETYGIKLDWINATRYGMQDALEKATLAKNVNYDLAIPRMMNVQAIVAGEYVYDLADREFIDLRNTYYNQNIVKSLTAHDHTFFVTGGFSNFDIETADVIYFNKNVLGDGSEKSSEELYQLVKDGKWTYDKLVSYAEAAYKDDGDGVRGTDDVYGAYISAYGRYFYRFGVTQAGVNEATGNWEITLNDEDKIDDIIDVIINTRNAEWIEPFYGFGYYGDPYWSFRSGDFLFWDRLLYDYRNIASDVDNIGIVPFPMLNEEQGRYYAWYSTQYSVAMCIPKITQDREMSEYFMDVLCWTGEEYTMKAYLETKKEYFKADAEMEMITDYIIPNLYYDAGSAVGWDELFPLSKTYSGLSYKNNFDQAYEEHAPDALKTIAEWNAAWGGYTEE